MFPAKRKSKVITRRTVDYQDPDLKLRSKEGMQFENSFMSVTKQAEVPQKIS